MEPLTYVTFFIDYLMLHVFRSRLTRIQRNIQNELSGPFTHVSDFKNIIDCQAFTKLLINYSWLTYLMRNKILY